MAKLLNNLEYAKLLILIYSKSNYQKEKALLLYRYVSHHLIHGNFNDGYIEKLAMDLKLINPEKSDIIPDTSGVRFQENLKEMDKVFTQFELIEIKTTVFEILTHGFYK